MYAGMSKIMENQRGEVGSDALISDLHVQKYILWDLHS